MITGLIENSVEPDFFLLLVISIGIILLFVLFIISILLIYQKRTFDHQQKINNMEQGYKQEMLKANLEVKEQTLSNVSQEIHDNIGQVLSFVKLNLGLASSMNNERKDQKINESKELVSQAITDLRDLSKSMSQDSIASKGLSETIRYEVERINRSQLIKVELTTEGELYSLGEQRELVLFRIVQETTNNTLKHGKAQNLKISLQYSPKLFTLTVRDDGSGFDIEEAKKRHGSGLKNIENRAHLIGAQVFFNSSIGKGTETRVSLNPAEQHLYADGNYSGSFS